MAALGFLGMRGTGDWVTDQRPKNWRETILLLYPNGMAPLTAMLGMMKSEKTDDPEFNWWEKPLATQGGAVTNIYDDIGLGTVYSGATGVVGTTVYVKVAVAVADEFREGHIALMRLSTNPAYDTRGKVTSVVKNGASSYIAVRLIETDATDLASADRILIIGNSNAEGAAAPRGLNYDPTKRYNFTQIFRTPTEITNTAKETRIRTGSPQQKENRREALELHSIEMEKAFLWGIRTEGTGDNGNPERTTWGMIPMIQSETTSSNISTYNTETVSDYAGKTWIEAGKTWLDNHLAQIFRYGSTEKMAFVGYNVLTAINNLAEQYGTVQLKVREAAYGIQVTTWVTPFGTLHMKTHPLFSYETTNSRSCVIFDPRNLKSRPLRNRDTKLNKNIQNNDVDGQIDEYLTETGLEFHHPDTFGYLDGFGNDNTN